MPVRPHTRDQAWLLPPRLEDMIPPEHPVRFVGTFIDEIDLPGWRDFGIEPEALGAPSYAPRLLLGVWCYGFMVGIRSCRRLEAACRDNLAFLWLTGLQTPDHNTLWRFYLAHRGEMRKLLKRTVRTAVKAGLIDLAFQAVDGSKVGGNASRDQLYTAEGLRRLLERTEQAIADLEAQNQTGGEPVLPELPKKLREKTALREKVRQALEEISEEERVNLTDKDAVLLKARGGYVLGYNAQAVASPLKREAGGGHLVTAAAVGERYDQAELLEMLEAAEENLGEAPECSLADAGYHSAENLALCEAEGRTVLMPDPLDRTLANPYHKANFIYDTESDSYVCPEGQTLKFQGIKHDRKGQPVRRYRAVASVCRACPLFGTCTKNYRHGRTLEVGPHDDALRRQRSRMATEAAQATYSLRKQVIEPIFGVVKEQLDGRRFLLRGQENVDAEWNLLSVAFNLRTLARVWRTRFA